MHVVARMRERLSDDSYRFYEVARDESGSLFVREEGKRKWAAVHMGINPDLETYLGRCFSNFGWSVFTHES